MKRTILPLLLTPFFYDQAFSQKITGRVLDNTSHAPVEYVNIGIKERNKGTVCDASGKFELDIENKHDNDSLLFSRIGYNSALVKISDLRNGKVPVVYLKENIQNLKKVTIVPAKTKNRTKGIKAHATIFQAGFAVNSLGAECGILIKMKKTAKIKRLNVNLCNCSYDSLFFRLNIYEVENDSIFTNILDTPIYITLKTSNKKERISIDLSEYNIWVDKHFLVSLEHVKDLGKGGLSYCVGFSKKTYYRSASQASWNAIPIGVGMNVELAIEK